MELDDLKELIKFLKETDITELQIEKNSTKIRIRREKMLSPIEVAKSPAPAPKQQTELHDEETLRLITITSPMVGTFYAAASPDSPPFIEPGAAVKKGQVVCIIEAMKLMNEIEAEVDGVVVRGLVENGQPVEYGEPLFLIEPV